MPWSEAKQAVRVETCSDGAGLAIHGLDQTDVGRPSAALCDNVYVIVSGYCALRCGEAVIECTAGDVLFVPKGHAHAFERLDGEFSIWRISPGPAADAV